MTIKTIKCGLVPDFKDMVISSLLQDLMHIKEKEYYGSITVDDTEMDYLYKDSDIDGVYYVEVYFYEEDENNDRVCLSLEINYKEVPLTLDKYKNAIEFSNSIK